VDKQIYSKPRSPVFYSSLNDALTVSSRVGDLSLLWAGDLPWDFGDGSLFGVGSKANEDAGIPLTFTENLVFYCFRLFLPHQGKFPSRRGT